MVVNYYDLNVILLELTPSLKLCKQFQELEYVLVVDKSLT